MVEYDAWTWAEHINSDNSIKLEALKKVMLFVMENELTKVEQGVLKAHFFENKSMSKIAMESGVNKATVSKNISRGVTKMQVYLKYCDMVLDIVPIDAYSK